MERILLTGDYPNLTELKIYNFNKNTWSLYFTVDTPFRHIFQQQITDLILVFENDYNEESCEHYTTNVYEFILKFFKNIEHLSIIGESYPKYFPPLLLRSLPITTCYSSTLHKLCIHVKNFDDFFALLDGRLKQLASLNVVINSDSSEYHSTNVYNMDDHLSDLKCFHLIFHCLNDKYDGQILPLLRRMSNIEALSLYITIDNRARFIDGKHVYNEIIVHKSRLRTFNFCFFTYSELNHLVDHLSKDDIQNSFSSIVCQQVDCIMKYQCRNVIFHVFSLPFMFDVLDYIGDTFPNIIFDLVRSLSVQDRVPFEHEFFSRIAWSFPLLKELIVFNFTPQLRKSSKLNSNDNQLYSIINEYPYLSSLCLQFAHFDYVDEFLNDTKTHLPRLTKLTVSYNKLRSVTKDFTNDRTRRNCGNVKRLNIDNEMRLHSKDIYVYFPLL